MAATADAYQAWPASPTPATGTASSPSVSRPEGLPGQQIQGGECAVKVGTLVSRRGDLTSINGGQDGCQPVSRLADLGLGQHGLGRPSSQSIADFGNSQALDLGDLNIEVDPPRPVGRRARRAPLARTWALAHHGPQFNIRHVGRLGYVPPAAPD